MTRVSGGLRGVPDDLEAPPPPQPTVGSGAAVVAPQPPVDRARLALARELVVARGTATSEDAQIVALELARMPLGVLQQLKAQGTTVVAMRDSVTDVRADLRGVTPRGWPPGTTWDSVPGLYWPEQDQVFVATRLENGERRIPRPGNGHGCVNLVMHETAHAIDYRGDPGPDESPTDAAFIAAREADLANLGHHQLQPGAAGLEETYAESLSRYFSGDPTLKDDWPHLHAYWAASKFATPGER